MEFNDDTISKLKFIGKIQKGEKINVKHMFIQPEGLATKISRSFINLDSRGNTLSLVKATITQSFNILYSFLTNGTFSHRNICVHIIDDIKKSKEGIKNLKLTYSSDIMLCCQLDCVIQEIDAKIGELSEKFPDLFKVSMAKETSIVSFGLELMPNIDTDNRPCGAVEQSDTRSLVQSTLESPNSLRSSPQRREVETSVSLNNVEFKKVDDTNKEINKNVKYQSRK
jgi:hypothetical protein